MGRLNRKLSEVLGATELKVEGFNIGSDDEKAMTKALDMCFGESERYLCTKHMKDNLNRFLIQKEEIDEKSRRKIVNEILVQVALQTQIIPLYLNLHHQCYKIATGSMSSNLSIMKRPLISSRP